MGKLAGIFMTLIWLFNYSMFMPVLFPEEDIVIEEVVTGSGSVTISFGIEYTEPEELNYTPELIMERFPEEYLNLTDIYYYYIDDNTKGRFNRKTGEIRLYIGESHIDWTLMVVVHEIGHLLYYNYANESIINEWYNLLINSTAITQYGEPDWWNSGGNEDFAEYYAIYNGFEFDGFEAHIKRDEGITPEKDEIMELLLREYPVFDLRELRFTIEVRNGQN